MLGTAARLTRLVVIAASMMGCMKDNNAQITRLVENIETVEQWSRSAQASEHVDWLKRSVAWDIVAAVTMTWAAHDVDDNERVEALLHSGLSEITAGPGDHVSALVSDWRRILGSGRCRTSAASDDDLRWIHERLTLTPPKGAGLASLQALAGYAKRASDTRDVVRLDCGGTARLLVGVLSDRLVPIIRE